MIRDRKRMLETVFDEIRVFDGVAERTNVQFERTAVRSRSGYCRSVTELIRKARDSGDGYFYLPQTLWPPDTEVLQLNKPWVVVSTHSPVRQS
jgi:hypothetical protein